jgi:hypothetical protein
MSSSASCSCTFFSHVTTAHVWSYLGGGIHGFSALIQDANEQVSFVSLDFHFLDIGYASWWGMLLFNQ